jgi:hypothetical protein
MHHKVVRGFLPSKKMAKLAHFARPPAVGMGSPGSEILRSRPKSGIKIINLCDFDGFAVWRRPAHAKLFRPYNMTKQFAGST